MQPNSLHFAEGKFDFYFDLDQWQIRKYDDHTYFQGFSGMGLKGVDFLGIHQQKTLLLIEVKNFTWRNRPFREKQVRQSLQVPEEIAMAVRQKMEDTLAGLQAIRIYYERKKARTSSWLDRFRKIDSEQLFWQQASHLLEENQLRCLLWMETEPEAEAFAEKVKAELSRHPVAEGHYIRVVRQSDYPYSSHWKMQIAQPKTS